MKLLPLVTIFTCVAFQASARVYTAVDFPGANATEAFAINSNGDIVGTYSDSGFRGHGFLLRSGTFITLDFPRPTAFLVHETDATFIGHSTLTFIFRPF